MQKCANTFLLLVGMFPPAVRRGNADEQAADRSGWNRWDFYLVERTGIVLLLLLYFVLVIGTPWLTIYVECYGMLYGKSQKRSNLKWQPQNHFGPSSVGATSTS